MGKGKSKNKNGGHGGILKTSKEDVDPILAQALARNEKSSSGVSKNRTGAAAAAASTLVKQQELAESSKAAMEISNIVSGGGRPKTDLVQALEHVSEEEKSDEESEDALQTLGEEDSSSMPGVRHNAQVKSASVQSDTSDSGEGRNVVKPPQGAKKGSFASLFAGNSKVDGQIKIETEDMQELDFPWERSLVGYFGGRFPGKQALKQIVDSWKVHVTIQFHSSGWIIFQFQSSEAQTSVLENGPYIIYGRPLLLKTMPQFSRFENEAISCFPVWIQLRNLPLELWSPNALGKICSKIGKPIHTDKMTATMERVSYARCLVEVNMAKELTHSVIINLPNGDTFEQVMFYENLPRFCTHCKVVGHSEAGCSVKKIKSKNNQTESTKTTEVVNAAELESGAAAAATGSQAATSIAEKSKGAQTEWVTKQAKATKNQSEGRDAWTSLLEKISEFSLGSSSANLFGDRSPIVSVRKL
ncbi:protein of unknown function DUF4283 protein [Actinidia chinensis var. chinensis]|uniref:DUF4283 domain-containing protein n=1 Tax=Actinidia chinensis var. chinensis TaxID=1590841 RepID=A0A2R6Q845_ACTCC|nr:protein of unknown function DUF4283 protein [Actinidia chinensis var. chinensis]